MGKIVADQNQVCVEINVVQVRHLQSAREGQKFLVVSGCASLEMLAVGCSRRPDFNRDSLLFSSALKCKLFHRSLRLSNTAERKMNTVVPCRTNSLCFLEHHNLPASCSSGATRSASHLKPLCSEQCAPRAGAVVRTALKALYEAQAFAQDAPKRFI